jgi:hypothetical protein
MIEHTMATPGGKVVKSRHFEEERQRVLYYLGRLRPGWQFCGIERKRGRGPKGGLRTGEKGRHGAERRVDGGLETAGSCCRTRERALAYEQ